MNKIYLFLFIGFTSFLSLQGQSTCKASAPVVDLSAAALVAGGLIENGASYLIDCDNLSFQLSPPVADENLPDFGYAFEVHGVDNDTALYVSESGFFDLQNPAGDGSAPGIALGSTIYATCLSFNLLDIDSLLNFLTNPPSTCMALEQSGLFSPGTCDILIGVGQVENLAEILDVAGAFGLEINSVRSAFSALITIDATAEILGGVCYAVSGWMDSNTVATEENIEELWSGPVLTLANNCPTAVAQILWADGLCLMPNPAQEVLNLGFEDNSRSYALSVFDLSGKLLLDGLSGDKISTAALQRGSYLLCITANGEIAYKRFVKM